MLMNYSFKKLKKLNISQPILPHFTHCDFCYEGQWHQIHLRKLRIYDIYIKYTTLESHSMHEGTLTTAEHLQPKCQMCHRHFAPLLHPCALLPDHPGGNRGPER